MVGRNLKVNRLSRRAFIGLLGAAAAWPEGLRAQSGRVRRIGALMSNAEGDPEGKARMDALRQGLAEFGWKDSGNLKIDWRWSGGDMPRMQAYAAELAGLAPDLIVVTGSANLRAMREATQSIPILFAVVNDPVGQGFIASLARPGGHITGFTFLEYSMVAKALDMLKQVAPALTRVAVMFNPQTYPYYDVHLPSFESDARRFSIEIIRAAVGSHEEIEATIVKLAKQPGSGLLIPPDTYTLVHRGTIIEAAARHRIPAIHSYRQSVREGGLISYGADTLDILRRTASYVDRILKGANPGELPAQAPTRFELAVNLKSAADLGLSVPPHLLALADEVIE